MSEWVVGVDDFGWRLGIGLHLDGGIGWFIEMSLSGLSSSLEQGGCQMFEPNSRRLSSPEHEGDYEGLGEYSDNKCGW
jgi:hypothetical protein